MVSVDNFTYGLLNPALAYAMSCVGGYLGLRCVTLARAYTGMARARWLCLAAVAIGAGLFMAAISGAMAYALWARAGWGRPAQIAIAGLGTITCFHPFSIASAVALVYMLRPPARLYFNPAAPRPATPPDATTETIMAGGLLAAVVLGVLLTALLTFLARSAHSWSPAG